MKARTTNTLDGNPLFAGDKYAGVSQEALYAIGGILKHCRAICAFSNPTTNSYKRLLPGFEAPVKLFFGLANRSAAYAQLAAADPRARFQPSAAGWWLPRPPTAGCSRRTPPTG